MTTTEAKVLDKDGNPAGALATRPATLDAEALNLLDPVNIDANAKAILEAAGAYRDTLMRVVLRQCSVSQFVVFRGEGENARENIYAMGAAVDAMTTFFGLHWSTPGPCDKLYEAKLHTDEKGGRWWWVESKLWRGDKFITSAVGKRKEGGYAKNELDAQLCAFENLKSRAGRHIFGFAAKTRADFKALGLDLTDCRTADFQDHKSANSDNPDEAELPFGKSKGTKVSAATDEDLAYFVKAVAKGLTDPAKAPFKAKNEKLLKAIQTEIDKRAAAPAQTAAEKEKLDQTLALIREEAAVLNVQGKALKELEEKLPGLSQAQADKWLSQYRERRRAESSARTPGEEG